VLHGSRPSLVPYPSTFPATTSPPSPINPARPSASHALFLLRTFCHLPATHCRTTKIQHRASEHVVVGFEKKTFSAHLHHHHIRLCFLDALAGSFHSLCSPQPSPYTASLRRIYCITFHHSIDYSGSERHNPSFMVICPWTIPRSQ
jgi:hypothetical protein